jgi:hypothetical protein
MSDPTTAEPAPDFTCWRDVATAFRTRRDLRAPMALAAVVVAEAYLACAVATMVGAYGVYELAVVPVLSGVFGHVPAPFWMQLATGAATGWPLWRISVRLMYRAAGRLFR